MGVRWKAGSGEILSGDKDGGGRTWANTVGSKNDDYVVGICLQRGSRFGTGDKRLCEYHPAYQWITGMSVVNYHSLSDFRVENGEALKKLFVEILAALESQGLITMTRVMQDGTKLEAAASKSSFRKEGKLRGLLRVAAEQVEALEQTEEGQENSERVRQAKRRASRERKKRLEAALKELESVRESKSGREEKDKVRVSTTDPDARIMKQSNGGYSPSYNVQVTTDS